MALLSRGDGLDAHARRFAEAGGAARRAPSWGTASGVGARFCLSGAPTVGTRRYHCLDVDGRTRPRVPELTERAPPLAAVAGRLCLFTAFRVRVLASDSRECSAGSIDVVTTSWLARNPSTIVSTVAGTLPYFRLNREYTTSLTRFFGRGWCLPGLGNGAPGAGVRMVFAPVRHWQPLRHR